MSVWEQTHDHLKEPDSAMGFLEGGIKSQANLHRWKLFWAGVFPTTRLPSQVGAHWVGTKDLVLRLQKAQTFWTEVSPATNPQLHLLFQDSLQRWLWPHFLIMLNI